MKMILSQGQDDVPELDRWPSISEDSPFMNVSQDELRKAAASVGLTTDRADLLWQALAFQFHRT